MNNGFQSRVTVMIAMIIIVVLSPFLLYHLYRHNWLLAGVLALVVASEALLIGYLRRGGSPWWAVHIISLTSSIGVLLAAHVLGLKATYWAFPVVLGNFFVLPMASALSLNVIVIVGVVWLMREQADVAVRMAAALVVLTAFGTVFTRQVASQQRVLSELSLIDPLTRALNRRALDEQLVRVTKDKARHRGQVSAIMLDLDHFKKINDRFDHKTGDRVLQKVVNAIHGRLRATDSLYRYGGEEFVVIATDTGLAEAHLLAEDLRRKVIGAEIAEIGAVTISAGVAELRDGEQPMAWLSRADEALYAAKRGGRNRVCVEPAV